MLGETEDDGEIEADGLTDGDTLLLGETLGDTLLLPADAGAKETTTPDTFAPPENTVSVLSVVAPAGVTGPRK